MQIRPEPEGLYSLAEIARMFRLEHSEGRVLLSSDGNDAVLLHDPAGHEVEGLPLDTVEFVGEWPEEGPMDITGSNLAILTRSPNLHVFVARGPRWQYFGRFTYLRDEFRLLLRGDRAQRGLVFTLGRTDPPLAPVSAAEVASPTTIELSPVRSPDRAVVDSNAFRTAGNATERQLLLEKALGGHRSLVADLVSAFTAVHSPQCLEDPRSLDLLVRWEDGRAALVEVKTLEGDHAGKIRLAVSQLLEYAHRLRKDHGVSAAHMILAVDRAPVGPPWLATYLLNDRQLAVIWRSGHELRVDGVSADTLIDRCPALRRGDLAGALAGRQ